MDVLANKILAKQVYILAGYSRTGKTILLANQKTCSTFGPYYSGLPVLLSCLPLNSSWFVNTHSRSNLWPLNVPDVKSHNVFW